MKDNNSENNTKRKPLKQNVLFSLGVTSPQVNQNAVLSLLVSFQAVKCRGIRPWVNLFTFYSSTCMPYEPSAGSSLCGVFSVLNKVLYFLCRPAFSYYYSTFYADQLSAIITLPSMQTSFQLLRLCLLCRPAFSC